MKKIASPLFQDLSEAELDTLAAAGHLRTRQFASMRSSSAPEAACGRLALCLRGSVHIENLDLWGTKSILSSVGAGQALPRPTPLRRGLDGGCCCGRTLRNTVPAHCRLYRCADRASAAGQAAAPPAGGIHAQEPQPFAAHLLHNAQDCARTVADLFFRTGATLRGRMAFEVPFNRQQMADYLNLDRSALSKELCKMRDEGLLEFDKNRFVLKQLPE